jgi:hypothetical protein
VSRDDLTRYLRSFYRIVRQSVLRLTSDAADIFGVGNRRGDGWASADVRARRGQVRLLFDSDGARHD